MNPSRLARATAAAAVTAAVVAVVRRDSPSEGTEADQATSLRVAPARQPPAARMVVIAGCLTVILALAIQVAGGLDSSARPLLSVVFYLAIPGWAVVGWLDLEDEILNWTLAIGLSVAIGILTS
jgi:hypothetical protein